MKACKQDSGVLQLHVCLRLAQRGNVQPGVLQLVCGVPSLPNDCAAQHAACWEPAVPGLLRGHHTLRCMTRRCSRSWCLLLLTLAAAVVSLAAASLVTCLQRVEPELREWISFYKPNLTISLVDHFQAYPKNAIPPQVSSTAAAGVHGSRAAADEAVSKPAAACAMAATAGQQVDAGSCIEAQQRL